MDLWCWLFVMLFVDEKIDKFGDQSVSMWVRFCICMALHTMLTVSSNLNNYHSVDGRRTCTVMSASSLLCYTRCRQKGLVFVPSCALCELSDCCYGAYTVHMPCYSVDCCCSCENVKACTHCAACNTDRS